MVLAKHGLPEKKEQWYFCYELNSPNPQIEKLALRGLEIIKQRKNQLQGWLRLQMVT